MPGTSKDRLKFTASSPGGCKFKVKVCGQGGFLRSLGAEPVACPSPGFQGAAGDVSSSWVCGSVNPISTFILRRSSGCVHVRGRISLYKVTGNIGPDPSYSSMTSA